MNNCGNLLLVPTTEKSDGFTHLGQEAEDEELNKIRCSLTTDSEDGYLKMLNSCIHRDKFSSDSVKFCKCKYYKTYRFLTSHH